MRPSISFLTGALLTLCWSLSASAGPHDAPASAEAPSYLSFTTLNLDLALENFVARSGKIAMYRMAGPSSMDCTISTVLNGVETCVVTASRPTTSIPSSLATR
jgi:hypothetical protein